MSGTFEPAEVAAALRVSIRLLVHRLRDLRTGTLSLPEVSVLSRLDRGGAATATALAKAEQISPHSIGAAIASLESRGFVKRGPDARDGRRVSVSLTRAGFEALDDRRGAKLERLVRALSSGSSEAELRRHAAVAPLLERLAERV